MKTVVIVLVLAIAGCSVGIWASSPAADTNCAASSALAFATIRPRPTYVAGEVQGAFTGKKRFFWRRYNCKGKSAQVRHLTTGLYDIRFPGLRIRTAVGSATTDQWVSVSVQPLGNDIVRVSLFEKGLPRDVAFTVVVY